jgi:hypothetical protein
MSTTSLAAGCTARWIPVAHRPAVGFPAELYLPRHSCRGLESRPLSLSLPPYRGIPCPGPRISFIFATASKSSTCGE